MAGRLRVLALRRALTYIEANNLIRSTCPARPSTR